MTNKIEQKKRECRFAIEHLMAGIWDASKDKDTEVCYDLRDKCLAKIEQALKEIIEATIDKMLVEEREWNQLGGRDDFKICEGHNQCCALQKKQGDKIKEKL